VLRIFICSHRVFRLRRAWSRSTLLHQRGSALADFLERHFKATKLLRV
jgi:hypothetical protein